MIGEQRHTGNITSGQFGLTVLHSCLRTKKIKTPPPHKKNLNFYGNRTSGTFGVAAPLKADPLSTPKEPLFANALFTFVKYNAGLLRMNKKIKHEKFQKSRNTYLYYAEKVINIGLNIRNRQTPLENRDLF